MRGSKMAGLVLALVLGGAAVGAAQEAPRQKQDGKSKQEWQGRQGPRGGAGVLLKGIDLTDAQKDQLKALHQARGEDARPGRGMSAEDRDAMKSARERGDTAALRKFRSERAAEMKQRHEQMLTEVRAILTPAQREIFDRNAAELETRMEKNRRGR